MSQLRYHVLSSYIFQAVRLHTSGFIQEGDMVRLNAIQRAQDIPEPILPYCLDTNSLTLAARYRIIICTCSTSGQLFSLGLRAGHFTHVFVDEAGQATEPDCLIPMGLAAGGEGQVRFDISTDITIIKLLI